MKPATETPIPASVRAPPIWSRRLTMELTMSAITASRPADSSARPEIFASISPESEIAAARRLVPPRSTPIEYSDMKSA